MSKWSDIKRAMRPAEMEDKEFRGLRQAFDRTLPHTPPEGARIEIPGVTWGGKPYLLTIIVKAHRIFSFEVDHDPDMSSPAFDAYTEKRAEWAAEGVGMPLERSKAGARRDVERFLASIPIEGEGRS